MIEKKLNHVFLIIDGNRRFAKKAGIPLEESYRLGAEKVTNAVKWILGDNGAFNLTIWGLALSNLKGRHAEDMMPILQSQENTFRSWLDDGFFSNIRIKFLGKINDEKSLKEITGFSFPSSYVEICKELEKKTERNSGKVLNILIAYSGKVDALDAQKRFAERYRVDSCAEPSFGFYEHSGPDIDLIIRTSETRPLSDGPAHLVFFSEFVSIDKFWPEIERGDIDGAIKTFYGKDRRFGG